LQQHNQADGKPSEVPSPTPHPLLQGGTPAQYVLRTLRSVRLSELTETLLTLPFDYAMRLLGHLARLLEQGSDVELCVKVTLLLLRIHQTQMVSTRTHFEVLMALRKHARVRLEALKDTVGTNLAALRYLKLDIEQTATANFFGEDEGKQGGKKRKYTTIAAKRQNKSFKHLRRR
jgi:U3 small nucleolar RNA-associated protein 12